jgi:hypothetical protein
MSANAADLMSPVPIVEQEQALPAVSAPNGTFELQGGYISPTGGNLRAAGTVSVPLGDRFGIQGDASLELAGAGLTWGGALHAFTRDPSRYLAGVTGGVVVAPGATLAVLGAEGELYMDRISLEGWAGVAGINYVDPAMLDKTGLFAIGDVAYYPMDDLRVAVGGSYLLGDLALHAGTEYLFRDLGTPISFTTDARLHTSGAFSLMLGLKGYLGGNDDNKTLIDRQRQDDPPNRALDLFGASAGILYATAPGTTATPPDYHQICLDTETSQPGWDWNSGLETCVPAG